jgi:hypothetical protein
MTHLELNNLASDYLEGLLEPARKVEVEAHLAECSACRELIEDVRGVIELCHSAEKLEPAPWLISKILWATVGERKPTLREQLNAFFRPAMQPRFAYAVAMAVFSFSIIVNAAGINLRNVHAEDLNPRTWFYRANRAGHLLYARAEKFYYDLRVVYEIESRFRQLRSQPKEEGKEAPKQEPPAGGSTDSVPAGSSQLAFNPGLVLATSASLKKTPKWTGKDSPTIGTGRSPSQ